MDESVKTGSSVLRVKQVTFERIHKLMQEEEMVSQDAMLSCLLETYAKMKKAGFLTAEDVSDLQEKSE